MTTRPKEYLRQGIFTETTPCFAGYPDAGGHLPQGSLEDRDSVKEVQMFDLHDESDNHCTADLQDEWKREVYLTVIHILFNVF
jgi:hypothetical protein